MHTDAERRSRSFLWWWWTPATGVGPKACRRKAMTHVFVWQASWLAETVEHVRTCSPAGRLKKPKGRWLCRVECFKGDEVGLCQRRRPKFDPSPNQNPLTDLHKKIGRRDYVLDGTRHAKFCSDRFRGFCSPIRDFAVIFG